MLLKSRNKPIHERQTDPINFHVFNCLVAYRAKVVIGTDNFPDATTTQ